MKYALLLLLQGCAAVQPLATTALKAIGPAAIDTLSQVVLEEHGEDATIVMESAGCFPVSDLTTENLANLVGDDEIDYVYISCRVRVRQ